MRDFLGGMMVALVMFAAYDSAVGNIGWGDWLIVLIVLAIVLAGLYVGERRESDE